MDIKILKNIYLFKELTNKELEKILKIANVEKYPANHVIFREGDAGDKFYVILKGKIRISKQVEGIGEEALAVLGAGSFFGEMSPIDDFPRSADSITNEPVELLTIKKEDFENLLFFDKDLAYTVLWAFLRTLSSRLRETNEKIKAFFAMSAHF